jgi:hypothetical protein
MDREDRAMSTKRKLLSTIRVGSPIDSESEISPENLKELSKICNKPEFLEEIRQLSRDHAAMLTLPKKTGDYKGFLDELTQATEHLLDLLEEGMSVDARAAAAAVCLLGDPAGELVLDMRKSARTLIELIRKTKEGDNLQILEKLKNLYMHRRILCQRLERIFKRYKIKRTLYPEGPLCTCLSIVLAGCNDSVGNPRELIRTARKPLL